MGVAVAGIVASFFFVHYFFGRRLAAGRGGLVRQATMLDPGGERRRHSPPLSRQIPYLSISFSTTNSL